MFLIWYKTWSYPPSLKEKENSDLCAIQYRFFLVDFNFITILYCQIKPIDGASVFVRLVDGRRHLELADPAHKQHKVS